MGRWGPAPPDSVDDGRMMRPVAGLMDILGHLSYDELTAEKIRLERARGGKGIDPDEWYRLHAVKALITRHEMESVFRNARTALS